MKNALDSLLLIFLGTSILSLPAIFQKRARPGWLCSTNENIIVLKSMHGRGLGGGACKQAPLGMGVFIKKGYVLTYKYFAF